ncbi:dioxygenase family protein [Chitinophagaceae bacterium MMS25-I14]
MKRGEFIKGLGILGVGSLLPFSKAKADDLAGKSTSCTLIPTETAGPYPWPTGGTSFDASLLRTDITESNSGVPLTLTLSFVNTLNNCTPIANAYVSIWHCNKDGYYSEYANQPGYLGTQSHLNETFFRGVQITDSNGQVTFTTIYPGWYTGRMTHIHFQVFLSSVLAATSQLAFPDTTTQTVYNSSLYSAHGQNTMTFATDNVFSDTANTAYEMLTLTGSVSAGYTATATIGVAASSTGLINIEPETGGQFRMGANYPNPFSSVTNIPLTLTYAAQVRIELYDLQGRKIKEAFNSRLSAGDQVITLDRDGLPAGSYAYQVSVENENGNFRQCKLLTAL